MPQALHPETVNDAKTILLRMISEEGKAGVLSNAFARVDSSLSKARKGRVRSLLRQAAEELKSEEVTDAPEEAGDAGTH